MMAFLVLCKCCGAVKLFCGHFVLSTGRAETHTHSQTISAMPVLTLSVCNLSLPAFTHILYLCHCAKSARSRVILLMEHPNKHTLAHPLCVMQTHINTDLVAKSRSMEKKKNSQGRSATFVPCNMQITCRPPLSISTYLSLHYCSIKRERI